jgi:hypothetical protein
MAGSGSGFSCLKGQVREERRECKSLEMVPPQPMDSSQVGGSNKNIHPAFPLRAGTTAAAARM